MAVAGPTGVRGTELLERETAYLRQMGWTHELIYVAVLRSAGIRRVPITQRGANVLIDAPRGKLYSALDVIKNASDAEQQTDGTPIYNAKPIWLALRKREPVLSVLLGNGTHS
jgi:hypothetical protein